MKIVGLITEYNPFHNGHQYHIEEAKRLTGADMAVVVMSGNYVQRGTPAIMPKHLRAEMALTCGANIVLELPLCYSTGSAELFAKGAVSLLDKLGVVDFLCFGSECGNLTAMQKIADILIEEPKEYRKGLQENLKKGLSYPSARQDALSAFMEHEDCSFILNNPNNILGIEYLKAIKTLKSPMVAYTIKRKESRYHDTELTSNFSSASAIRNLLAYSGSAIHTQTTSAFEFFASPNLLGELEGQVPSSCFALLKDYHRVKYPIYQNDFSLLLKYKLLNKSAKDLCRYMDVSEELANRIYRQINNFFNYDQFCELLKTKEVTYTRINRALLHILLGLKENDVTEYQKKGYHFYARVLGFRKDSQKILTAVNKKGKVPLLTKLLDTDNIPSLGQKMLRYDILASNLYESVITDRFKTAFENEYVHSIVRI